MDFAVRLQIRAQTARGHDVVDGDLQTRCEGILTAETQLGAWKSAIQSVHYFTDGPARDGHLGHAARQVAQRCGDEDDRHGRKPGIRTSSTTPSTAPEAPWEARSCGR